MKLSIRSKINQNIIKALLFLVVSALLFSCSLEAGLDVQNNESAEIQLPLNDQMIGPGEGEISRGFWEDDARWFLNQSPNTCDSRWNATNVGWAWIQRESKRFWVQAMNAEFSGTATLTVYWWNGSSWQYLESHTIQPRTYITRWYNYGSKKGWLKAYLSGPRVNLHFGWDIYESTDGIGKICYHSY